MLSKLFYGRRAFIFFTVLIVQQLSGMQEAVLIEPVMSIVLEGTTRPLSMRAVWNHIDHFVIRDQQAGAPNRLAVHGFHYYGSRKFQESHPDITEQKKGTLIKINRSLWLFTINDIGSWHRAFLISGDKGCEKTFFPATWNKKQILDFLSESARSAVCIDTKCCDWGKEYQYKASVGKGLSIRYIIHTDSDGSHVRLISAYPLLDVTELEKSEVFKDKIRQLKQLQAKERIEEKERESAARMVPAADASVKVLNPKQNVIDAIKNSDIDELYNLREKGVSFAVIDMAGNSGLHYAVESEDYLVALFLLDSGVVNHANKEGITPLMKAIDCSMIEAVSLLINSGAKLDVVDTYNKTALMHAVRLASKKNSHAAVIARMLLAAGADPNIQDGNNKDTALMQALGYDDLELVHVLLDFGADYSTIRNRKNNTASDIESKKYKDAKIKPLQSWDSKKTAWIKEHNATDFLYCVKARHRLMVEKSLKAGQSDNPEQALWYALENNDEKMVALLLAHGADPRTALHQNVGGYKVSADIKTRLNKRASELVQEQEWAEAKQEKEAEERYSLFVRHLRENTLEKCDRQICAEYKERRDSTGFTPLLYAVNAGFHAAVAHLLKQGVNLHAVDAMQYDALAIACKRRESQMISLLLGQGSFNEQIVRDHFKRLLLNTKSHDDVSVLRPFVTHRLREVLAVLESSLLSGDRVCIGAFKKSGIISQEAFVTFIFDCIAKGKIQLFAALAHEYPELLTAQNNKKQNPITAAADSNEIGIVRICFQLGILANTADGAGRTPLSYATVSPVKQEIERKIEQEKKEQAEHNKQELNSKLKAEGWPAAVRAAALNDTAALHAMRNENTDALDIPTPQGEMPLHVAVRTKQYAAFNECLGRKKQLNAVDNDGYTPLMLALEDENYEYAQLLLETGASAWWLPGTCLTCTALLSIKNGVPEHLRRHLAELEAEHLRFGTELQLKIFEENPEALLHPSFVVAWREAAVVKKYDVLLKLRKNSTITLLIRRLLDAQIQFPQERIFDLFCIACQNKAEELVSRLLAQLSKECVHQLGSERKRTALHEAARYGCLKLIGELIERYGLPVDLLIEDDVTPLAEAIHHGQFEAVCLLLERFKANIQHRVSERVQDHTIAELTMAAVAAKAGQTEILRLLLDKDRSLIDSRDAIGATLIHYALISFDKVGEKGRELIQMLIRDYKIDPALRLTGGPIAGSTPVHVAAAMKNTFALRTMLDECRPLVMARNKYGHTPLHFAAGYGAVENIVILIDKYGADPEVITDTGETILHRAAIAGRNEVVELLGKKCKKLLMTKDHTGYTALHHAAQAGHLSCIHALLAACDNDEERMKMMTECNEDGYAPVHVAACFDAVDVVRFFVHHYKFHTLNGKNNQYPLHVAAYHGAQKTIDFLLSEHENQLDITDLGQRTPLMAAAVGGSAVGLRALLKNSAKPAKGRAGFRIPLNHSPKIDVRQAGTSFTALHYAANTNVEAVEVLLSHGAHIEARNLTGMTPLHMAAVCGKLDVFNFLIAHGADLTARDFRQCSVLHYAAGDNREDIVRVLLTKYKVDINAPGRNGMTALHEAAFFGRSSMVKLLIEHGADLRARRERDGNMPIHCLALKPKQTDCLVPDSQINTSEKCAILEMFFEKGVSFDERNSLDQTPVNLAYASGQSELVSALLKHGGLVV